MKKVKVKMLESLAILGDPKPKEVLDEKYKKKIEQMNKGRRTPFSADYTETLLADWKKHDRYGEKPWGFSRDMSFRPDQEALLNAELAEKWEEQGICIILREPDAKKAA